MHPIALLVAGITCFFALWLMGCGLSYGVARLWLALGPLFPPARQARMLLGAILLPLLIAGGLAAHATWTAATCPLVEQERGFVGPCVHATRHLCAHVSDAMARLTQGAAWGGLVLAVLLTGAVSLVVICSFHQSRRRRARWTALPPSRKLQAAIAQATDRGKWRMENEVPTRRDSIFRFSRVPFFETSDDIPGAALVGCFKPRGFVAQSLVKEATRAELLTVLRHEIAHAVRRDNLARAVVGVCRKLLFFFPPMWWLCREWEKYVEFACDDAAARTPQDALHLASALVKACRSSAQVALETTALVGEASIVEQRVRRLLHQSHRHDLPPSVSASTMLLPTLLAAVLLIALAGTAAASFDLSLHCAVETLARLSGGSF